MNPEPLGGGDSRFLCGPGLGFWVLCSGFRVKGLGLSSVGEFQHEHTRKGRGQLPRELCYVLVSFHTVLILLLLVSLMLLFLQGLSAREDQEETRQLPRGPHRPREPLHQVCRLGRRVTGWRNDAVPRRTGWQDGGVPCRTDWQEGTYCTGQCGECIYIHHTGVCGAPKISGNSTGNTCRASWQVKRAALWVYRRCVAFYPQATVPCNTVHLSVSLLSWR